MALRRHARSARRSIIDVVRSDPGAAKAPGSLGTRSGSRKLTNHRSSTREPHPTPTQWPSPASGQAPPVSITAAGWVPASRSDKLAKIPKSLRDHQNHAALSGGLASGTALRQMRVFHEPSTALRDQEVERCTPGRAIADDLPIAHSGATRVAAMRIEYNTLPYPELD